ncbi:hypothetical protein L0Y65_04780 [Candidatus Micrarchaeota archaeon]|nr:hypothetical protein [Candidatus Micrarchaeota archaeon]
MLDEALTQLCSNSKTFLGAFAMICIILSVFLFIANYFWNGGKPKASKKTRLWLAGAAILVIAFISIVTYIVTSPLLGALGLQTEDPCLTNPPVPPYCGEYCRNQNIKPASENCTCIMY